MNAPFTKGHEAAALDAALSIPDPALRQAAMDRLTLGGRKLVSPQAGLNNTDPAPVPGSPADKSRRTAAELAELGLYYFLCDHPLPELESHPIAIRGAEMLAQFAVPRMLHGEGPAGLFRMNMERRGPDRIGKLALADYPTGWGYPFRLWAHRRLGAYGSTHAEWSALQRGTIPVPQQLSISPVPITTGRDIASLAHQDPPTSIGHSVVRLLLAHNAPLSTYFPRTPTEAPFVSPGGAWEMLCALGIATLPAGQLGWRLKFRDFRRSRPEELWPLAVRGELHESFLGLAGWLVDLIGPYLPLGYAEGCPLHSADPSGHGIDAGVWATLCKAWFADGPIHTLGIESLHVELDLLAWHQTGGRSWARIHYRRDLTAGLRIGERYALDYLRQQKATSPQPLGTTTFIGVDGKAVVV
jgi:hypothetical protein